MSRSQEANEVFPGAYGALRDPKKASEPAPVKQQGGNASEKSVIINVTKNIIGSGLLALPVAIHNASVLPGMLSLAVFAATAAYSYGLLGYCCAATGARTYHGLWSATVGSKSAICVQGCILLDNCFTLWAYSTLVADFFGKAFLSLFPGNEMLQNRGLVLGVIGTFFFLPFCMAKSLDTLKYTSALGLLAIVYSLLYVISDYSVSDAGVEHFVENMFEVKLVIFKSLALFAFAFLCHYAAPQLYTELQDRSPKKWYKVTACSFTAAFSIFALFALCGYGRWGGIVKGNVLKNYDEGSNFVLLMWVAMAFNVMFSYPLIFAVFKENLYGVLGTEERLVSNSTRLMIVICGVGATITLGTVFEDCALVMGICGSVCSSAIEFIFPALIYLNLPAAALSKGFGGPGPMKTACYFLILVGCIAMVIGTGATIAAEMK